MAEEDLGQDRSEAPTDEQRDKFRKRGEVVHSREITSALVLALLVGFLGFYIRSVYFELHSFMSKNFRFENLSAFNSEEVFRYLGSVMLLLLKMTLPIFSTAALTSIAVTLIQTRFNFSWERVSFNLAKLNPIQGLQRMVSWHAIIEVIKSLGKVLLISLITGSILYSESHKFPSLLNVSIRASWLYWIDKAKFLFLMILIALLLLGTFDYMYSYIVLENRMKMSRQQIRDEYKERELDPLIKQRMRRMQKEIANRKTVESTRKATVLITNPTHYSIAIRYELGMPAPIMVAKGMDHIALQMRQIAKSMNIPIIENKPLAQTLYKTLKENQEIPPTLYKVLSEIISHVFRIKGIRIKN